MGEVLETTKFVVENSRYVSINHTKINEFCSTFTRKHINHWWNVSPFKLSTLSDDKKLMFLLVFNSLSFCYWGKPKWTINYKGKEFQSGSFGMVAAIGRAYENKIPILDARFLSTISKNELRGILKANVEIPLFEERWKILKEIGTILTNKFNGNFGSLIKLADNDAMKLLQLIVDNFPSFDDKTVYKGKKIYFYKRAQLLVADIYQTFNCKGYGKLKNIEQLTACADYKLPQALRKLGIFSYAQELSNKIDNKIIIRKNSEMEIEIRANTIWAVELIKEQLKKQIPNVLSIHINDSLWLIGVSIPPSDKPYHLTRTTFY